MDPTLDYHTLQEVKKIKKYSSILSAIEFGNKNKK